MSNDTGRPIPIRQKSTKTLDQLLAELYGGAIEREIRAAIKEDREVDFERAFRDEIQRDTAETLDGLSGD